MPKNRTKEIKERISKIKEILNEIGPMRPGSLTLQCRDSKTKTKPYWQVSYTRAMKSHTDYVRKNYVSEMQKEIANYKIFKELTEEWINLGIELSKLEMKKHK